MGPDLLLCKEPDHQFMLSPEPASTAMDTKARNMVVFSFRMFLNINLKLYVVLYDMLHVIY